MTNQYHKEPDDLSAYRMAAHMLIDALYEYLHLIRESHSVAVSYPWHELAAVQQDDSVSARQWAEKHGLDCDIEVEVEGQDRKESTDHILVPFDPRMVLTYQAQRFHGSLDELLQRHEAFAPHFDPLEEEFSAVHDPLVEICGCEARSFAAALDILTDFVITQSFETIEFETPGDEWDEELSENARHGFTLNNWQPVCLAICDRIQSLDLEKTVHEWIEREAEWVWDNRLENGPFPNSPDQHKVRRKTGRPVKWSQAVEQYEEWMTARKPRLTSGKYQEFIDEHRTEYRGLTANKLRAAVNLRHQSAGNRADK